MFDRREFLSAVAAIAASAGLPVKAAVSSNPTILNEGLVSRALLDSIVSQVPNWMQAVDSVVDINIDLHDSINHQFRIDLVDDCQSRVLLTVQADPRENGVYVVDCGGFLSRALDMQDGSLIECHTSVYDRGEGYIWTIPGLKGLTVGVQEIHAVRFDRV